MIYLKIENNKGYYRVLDGDENWIEIDQINKDDLLKLGECPHDPRGYFKIPLIQCTSQLSKNTE